MTIASPLVPTGPSRPLGLSVCTSVDEPFQVLASARVITNSHVSPGCATIHVPLKSRAPGVLACAPAFEPLSGAEFETPPSDSVIVPLEALRPVGLLLVVVRR